jgi:thioredoxin-related protein
MKRYPFANFKSTGIISILILISFAAVVYAELAGTIDFNNAILEAKKQNKFLMLYFYSEKENIAVTKKMEEKTLTNKDILPYFAPFIIVNLNSDKEPELIRKYRVTQFPTIVFSLANGTEVDRVVGYTSVKKFQTKIQNIASKNLTYGSLEALIKKLREKPRDVTVLYAFAVEQMNIRDFKYAERVLRQILELDPMDDSGLGEVTRINLAFCLLEGEYSQEKNGSIIKVLEELLQKYPQSPYKAEASYLLGDSYYTLGNNPKAIEIYQQALPTAAEPWLTKIKKQLDRLENK